MKIVHVIDSEGFYGAEVMLLNLSAEQTKLGHRSVIASIGKKGDYHKPLESEAMKRGIEIECFRMSNGPNFIGAWDILRFAKSEGFDILHLHGYKSDILMGFIPKVIRKLPVVSTVHGWTSVNRFSKLWVYEALDGISLRCMDAVCLVADSMREHPRVRKLNRHNLYIVRNGISSLDEEILPPKDEISAFCQGGYTLISIGRLTKEKGHSDLILAFSYFVKEYQDTRLVIIGEGPERVSLEAEIKSLGIEGKVMLPGYKEDAWKYLQCCRQFVLPSLTEGFPITLLEAMRSGISVVATAVGGIPKLIKHGRTGLLVTPKNVMLLSQSMKDLIDNDQLAKIMAQNAKELVNRNYSSRVMALRYDAVYHSLARGISGHDTSRRFPYAI